MKILPFNGVLIPFLLLIFMGCKHSQTKEFTIADTFKSTDPQATSLLGTALSSAVPSSALLKKWAEKKRNFEQDPNDVDHIIWYGRFTAYMGDYLEAIEIYTKGIQAHPNDARLYRHRGHRLITIRKFAKAISDFTKAKSLIDGQENEIEPDGMPNAQNIPVSTLHGNIYYHLGLAYYLSDDLPKALEAYTRCLNTSQNSDNIVSATHWIYSILSKLDRRKEAEEALNKITVKMEVIENQSYLDLCHFYKGIITEDQLLTTEENTSANDAVKYGLANWHMHYGNKERGLALLKSLSEQESWASFGVIAAEADLVRAQ